MQYHPSASALRTRQRGFTLVEMLVVIAIIVVLAGLLLMVVSKSYGSAQRVRAQADLQVIALGLEAYKQDFGDYPRPAGAQATDAARTLCWALVGADPASIDGVDGPGFRTRRQPGPDNTLYTVDDIFQGKVYGPYVDLSKFDLTGGYLRERVLSDDVPNSPPILYIPARAGVATQQQLTAQTSYFGRNGYDNVTGKTAVTPATRYMFDLGQCYDYLNDDAGNTSYRGMPASQANGSPTFRQLRAMLGDADNSGNINGGEQAACTAPFILWAPGKDGMFGMRYDGGKYVTDDVANFDFDSSVLVK